MKTSFSTWFLYRTIPGRLMLSVLTRPLISRAAGRFLSSPLSRPLILPYVKSCHLELSLCENTDFRTFNDCFTRRYKASVRPLCPDEAALMAPCDGSLSAYPIQNGLVIPVKQSRYSKVADGTYFCSISTPDTYVLFHDRLAKIYEEEGISQAEADQKAAENIGMVELPRLLPAKGDLSVPSADMEEKEWVSNVVMGGVNGYGISAYTKHREACVTFVNFATGYDLVKKRAEILGIAPTRSDVASDIGGVSGMIFESLNEGHIYLMPSVKAVDQIWDPMQTLLSDVAKDAFRERNGETVKYPDQDAMQAALEKVSKNIYDAIYTLAQ